MDDQKLTVLHTHYQDTFAHIQDNLRVRDRLFMYVLIAMTLMLFQLYAPAQSAGVFGALMTRKLELDTPIDISYLSSVLWFVFVVLALHHYNPRSAIIDPQFLRTVVHIERQYQYIHALEEQLSAEYAPPAFTREGKAYLRGYPLFARWSWMLYTIVYPALVVAMAVAKILNEMVQPGASALLLTANGLMALAAVVSSVLCAVMVHWGK